jgi:hypothetical protein
MSQCALEIPETLVQAAQEVAQAQQTSLDCGVLLTVSNRHNRLACGNKVVYGSWQPGTEGGAPA